MFFLELSTILVIKYRISTALIIENPVRSPIVPPIADIMSTNFAALSLVILSSVGVSKKILTNLNLFFHSNSEKGFQCIGKMFLKCRNMIGSFLVDTFQCRWHRNPFCVLIVLCHLFTDEILQVFCRCMLTVACQNEPCAWCQAMRIIWF